MRNIKSERLKKLESELKDLEQWLKLGLVPKKDVEKHKEEIEAIRGKIDEEKERLQFLKESGEAEEYIAPKRAAGNRAGYTEMPTIPDIDGAETVGMTDTGFNMDTDFVEMETSAHDEKEAPEDDEDAGEDKDEDEKDEDEESYFSDKNRWKRGGIIDPDADNW